MNREERRKLAKRGNAELFAEVVWQAQEDDINYQATRNTLAIVCLVMRDKYGFGGDRLRRLLEGVADTAEAVNSGHVKISEIVDTLKAEVPNIKDFWGKSKTI